MPIARVELPDGRIGRFDVPEGTTPEQVESFVFNGMSGKTRKVDAIEQSAIDAQKPTALERFGRGFADVTEGVKQGALTVKDLFTGGKEADAYTKDRSAELATYEKGRGPDAGADWLRMGGSFAATLPAAGVSAPARAGMLLKSLVSGGVSAGTAGTMFTPEGESKGAQTALGFGAGAAMPAAAQAVKAGARSVGEMFRGPQSISLPQLQGELTLKLQQQGIDFNALTGQVKTSLLKDAEAALSAGGTLDDAMLRNKALIESVGATPTRAAVTRAPRDWQTEKNLRGIQGVGDDIVKRDQTNAQALIDYTQKLRQQTGGKTSTPLEAGESAIGAIRKQDAAKEEVVDNLYKTFRETGAQNSAVPDVKIVDALGRVTDEIGTENIPAAVLNRLKDFGFMGGERTKLLTVNEADKLNRLINNNNPGHGPASLALGRVKQALNEALLEVPGDGSQALLKARSAAAQRFSEQQAGKGISAAIDDVSPDRFVQKFILGADARDVRATLAELGKSPAGTQAIADVKGHVLDNLLMKATGASNLDDVMGKPFSGVRFAKALDAIPPEKLHLLFKPEELTALRTLQKASKLLTEEVPFSDVNHSKTSSALANLFLKIGNTPMLGKLVSPIIGAGSVGANWVKDANSRKQVAEALLGSAGRAGERPPLPTYPIERFLPGTAGVSAAEAYQQQ